MSPSGFFLLKQDIFDYLVPLMRHLMQNINATSTNKLAGDCLKLLIQRYTAETASLLTNKSMALNMFLDMLKTENLIGTDIVTVQQAAVTQVRMQILWLFRFWFMEYNLFHYQSWQGRLSLIICHSYWNNVHCSI